MKNSLSKGTLDTIEAVAANRNQTVDEYLLPGNTTPLNSPEVPEMRNDKEGENILTVEIRRHRNDKWRTLTFVKENGQWKMDLNRFLDELYPDLKTPDSSAPPPE